MKIKKVEISNYRIFQVTPSFVIDNINIPDGENLASGLTIFVGENACGKTSILDAISLPLLNYKADSFSVDDLNIYKSDCIIKVFSQDNFNYKRTMPRGDDYIGKGFQFNARLRSRTNRTYLSSIIVNDTKFIRADNTNSPNDNSPDIRVNVNNPFSGKRFDENDVLYLEKTRTYQLRSGTYNSTRFDRIMEDFNYQYLHGNDELKDINLLIQEEVGTNIDNEFLNKAIRQFNDITGHYISLQSINNLKPFSGSFFAKMKVDHSPININSLGSGYEMIFSLIYSYYLAKQSEKELIILIDEPELHLHPNLQSDFVKFIAEASKEAQIIITSHSPLLVKQVLEYEKTKIIVITKGADGPIISSLSERVLPYLSADEINYLAFGFSSIEYHNQLYGTLQERNNLNGENQTETYFVTSCGISKTKRWQRERNGELDGSEYDVTLQTFIRNKIHHPENRTMQTNSFTTPELTSSIEEMREILLMV